MFYIYHIHAPLAADAAYGPVTLPQL